MFYRLSDLHIWSSRKMSSSVDVDSPGQQPSLIYIDQNFLSLWVIPVPHIVSQPQ